MARTSAMTNRQKAAVLLIALGTECTGAIFQNLPEEDVEMLMVEVARLEMVSHSDRTSIINEFRYMCQAQEIMSEGGIELARKFLETAYGSDRANVILGRVIQALQVVPFDFVKKSDPAHVASFIQDEHPQTIALILAHLAPQMAASVISGLPTDIRAEVARRIAIMDRTPPEAVQEIERVLRGKMSSVIQTSFTVVGGVKALVDVLNCVDRQSEKSIIENLRDNNPELAEEIKRLMFVFEDITTLDDASIQKVLREVDVKQLGLALKGVGEEVHTRILKNMSKRAANMLTEDMEFLGPVRLRAVEEAQQEIVGIIRRLEESGEIVVSRGVEEQLIA